MTIRIPLISNEVILGNHSHYCAILGESPSKGARSPVLWNECFNDQNISCYFYPFDVSSQTLPKLIEYLKSDNKFLGGAVAVPHKEGLLPLLDEIEEEAKLIGAVNLIYKNENGLCGANTDGLGAVASLAEKLGSSIDTFAHNKSAIVFGTGGAAKAVAVYMAKALGKEGKIFIVGRNDEKISGLVDKCATFTTADGGHLNNILSILPSADYFINSTAVGYENIYSKNGENFYLEPYLPTGDTPIKGFSSDGEIQKKEWLIKSAKTLELNYKQSLEKFKILKENAIVMDVVYQPEETMFLRMANWLGYNTLSGKRMNLLQAAFGFQKTFYKKSININKIVKLMEKIP